MPGCSTGSRRRTPSPRTPCEGCTVRLADVGRAVCELVASQLLTAADRPGRGGAPLSTRARRRPGPAGCVALRPRERRFGSAVARGSATDARSRRAVRALRPVRLIRVPRAPWTHARSPRAGRAARYRSESDRGRAGHVVAPGPAAAFRPGSSRGVVAVARRPDNRIRSSGSASPRSAHDETGALAERFAHLLNALGGSSKRASG